jgi:hypothetical protein
MYSVLPSDTGETLKVTRKKDRDLMEVVIYYTYVFHADSGHVRCGAIVNVIIVLTDM